VVFEFISVIETSGDSTGGSRALFASWPADGLPWRIGIHYPREADKLVAEIALPTGALATARLDLANFGKKNSANVE
jgi:hypothetical protein